ncbi:MAG: beta-barrel assembly-enhancing protease [Chromatiales bacterium]
MPVHHYTTVYPSGSNVRRLLFLIPLVLAPFLGVTHAADDLPDFGDSAGSIISPAQERRLGEAFVRELRSKGQIVDDAELEEYIQSLGLKLAWQADNQANPFDFFVVDSPVLNAFAVPGGFIGVHTGLILQTQTESELAGVIAHEVSHVTQRHSARMFEAASKLSIPAAVGVLGAILLGAVNPQAGQAAAAVVAAGQQQYALNFTRANEQEADRIGIQVMARAGFNPHGMPDFFERMQTANRYSDPAAIPEFLRTHPVTTNRIAESRDRADQFAGRQYDESQDYHLLRAKVKVQATKDPREAVQFYADSLRAGQYRSENVARYGYALALIRAGEYGKSRLQLDRLLQTAPENPHFLLAMARLNVAERGYEAALRNYQRVIELYPEHRPAVLGRVQALLASGRPKEARTQLRDYMTTHSADTRSYQLLAEAAGEAGDKIESHIAQAEYYYGTGELGLAIEQLKLARQEAGITYYQSERVQARLDQFQKEFDEEKKEKQLF